MKSDEDGILTDGYLETEGSVIRALGPMDEITPKSEDIDLAGAFILPGLIDAHTCLGLKEDSMRKEGNDWNEHGWTLGPELCAADGFNPDDRAVRCALAGGVTAAAVSPGNENLIGGQIAVMKLCPDRPNAMVLDPFCALKLAVGEQVKRKNNPPCTRMAVGAMLRECFRNANAVQKRGSQALRAVLQREKPVFIHADRCDDIAFAVERSKEFGLREQKALESITITPAKLLGVADRIGSLRAGKDADLVIWSGHPFSYLSRVLAVLVDGQIVMQQ